MAKNKASRYALSAPPVKTPQQAADAVIQGDKPPCTAGKEAIAAFYLKLARSQPYTNEELRAAIRRLGIPRIKFMKDFNLNEEHQVPEASSFLGEYMVGGWFSRNQGTLEQLTAGYLLGRMDLEFTSYLKNWWKEEHEIEKVAYRKDKKGKVTRKYYVEPDEKDLQELPNVTGSAPEDKGIPIYTDPDEEGSFVPDYRKPETGAELADSVRETKKELRLFKWLSSGWRKKDKVCQWKLQDLIRKLKRKVDGQHDPELRQEDAWKAAEAINRAIEKSCRQKK